jgi:predicted DNA-binding protein (MmcQ/YjbR family)
MASLNDIKTIVSEFPEVEEAPHFDKVSFRIKSKIFATIRESEKRATVKFSQEDQTLFCLIPDEVFYPVPNKWGQQGWTHVNLEIVSIQQLSGALETAYCQVAPTHLKQLLLNK